MMMKIQLITYRPIFSSCSSSSCKYVIRLTLNENELNSERKSFFIYFMEEEKRRRYMNDDKKFINFVVVVAVFVCAASLDILFMFLVEVVVDWQNRLIWVRRICASFCCCSCCYYLLLPSWKFCPFFPLFTLVSCWSCWSLFWL